MPGWSKLVLFWEVWGLAGALDSAAGWLDGIWVAGWWPGWLAGGSQIERACPCDGEIGTSWGLQQLARLLLAARYEALRMQRFKLTGHVVNKEADSAARLLVVRISLTAWWPPQGGPANIQVARVLGSHTDEV